MPYTITGPATVKIFVASPGTIPSDLNSIAGDVTALENPVIGTSVPAPAYFPILSNTPIAVNSDAMKIRVIEVMLPVSSLSAPREKQSFLNASPRVQIRPPTQNARKVSFKMGDFFEFLSTIFLFFILYILIKLKNLSYDNIY